MNRIFHTLKVRAPLGFSVMLPFLAILLSSVAFPTAAQAVDSSYVSYAYLPAGSNGTYGPGAPVSISIGCPVIPGQINYFLDGGPATITSLGQLAGSVVAGTCYPATPIVANLGTGLSAGTHYLNVAWTFSGVGSAQLHIYFNVAASAQSCTSTPNVCGMTNTGTLIGGIACNAVTPLDSSCPPDTIAPSAPTGLSGTAVAGTGGTYYLTLSWNASSDNYKVSGYNLYTDGSFGQSYPSYQRSASGISAYPAGSTHTYTVQAYDAAGNLSSQSAAFTYTVPGGAVDATPPSTPTGVRVANFDPATNSVTIAWSPSTDNVGVNGYNLSMDGSFLQSIYNQTSMGGITVMPGTTHNFTVQAYDVAGNVSSQSAAFTYTVPGSDMTAPSAPTGLATSNFNASAYSVTLSWSPSTDNIGVTGYNVFFDGAFLQSTSQTSMAGITVDPAGSRHTFTVQAYDAAGNTSSQSAAFSYTTPAPQVPAPLPDLTVVSASSAAARAGSATTLSATIADVNASTGVGFTSLFQRATSAAGANAIDIGTKATAVLAAGGVTTVSLSYTFPSAGTYYVRACADQSSAGSAGVIAESVETNNCGAWTAVAVANGICANGASDFPTCTPPLVDACGPGNGTTPQRVEPIGTSACAVGVLNSSVPADTSLAWKWSCGSVASCSAPKYGCTTSTDTNYNPSGPSNTAGCSNVCTNGGNNYPTCTPPTCSNGAINAPACTTCAAPQTLVGGTCTCPNGYAFIGGTCTACSNGGCSGAGGTAANPTGALVCNNRSASPVVSWLGSHGCVLPADGSGCDITSKWTVTGAPLGTTVDLKVTNPTLPGGAITHAGLPLDTTQTDHVTTAGPYTLTLLDDDTKLRLGETLAIAVCAPGSTLDPVTGLCVAPGAPSTPVISALWQGATYLGPTASAHDPSGYQLLAQATSPTGANLSYYFEWYGSNETGAAQWSDWVGSGGWGAVTHYVDYGPGTYHARAWAVDANGVWSLTPSDWVTFTLSQPALSVECVGTPGNPYIGQTVRWTSTVTGGSGSIVYVWSGTDDLFDTTATVDKTYTTPGPKIASLSITDSKLGQTASANCSAGALQPNGPTLVDTFGGAGEPPAATGGGSSGSVGIGGAGAGIDVGACAVSISAIPSTVTAGQNTSIAWSLTGGPLCADSCTGSGFDSGGRTSGTAIPSVIPSPPQTTYGIACTGGTYGPPSPANTTVTVTVPTASITVNGQSGTARVNPGIANNAVVEWSSTGAVSCTGTNFPTGGNPSGSVVRTADASTIYTVDCENAFGVHATASASVNVQPLFEEF